MWKVLEAHENMAYLKPAQRFDRAKGERLGKNGAVEACGNQKVKSLDGKLRYLDHPIKNGGHRRLEHRSAVVRPATGGPLWWPVGTNSAASGGAGTRRLSGSTARGLLQCLQPLSWFPNRDLWLHIEQGRHH